LESTHIINLSRFRSFLRNTSVNCQGKDKRGKTDRSKTHKNKKKMPIKKVNK